MPQQSEDVRVDLSSVTQLLDRINLYIGMVNKGVVPPGNTPEKAEIRRTLAFIADSLDRAASETRSVYHAALNGFPDPLEEYVTED